jgi:hypothetical protein
MCMISLTDGVNVAQKKDLNPIPRAQNLDWLLVFLSSFLRMSNYKKKADTRTQSMALLRTVVARIQMCICAISLYIV